MNLRHTRAVTVTDPPTLADQQLIAEYDAIATAEPTAADAARMAEIAQALAPAEQMRITVATINTVQFGRYEANRRTVINHIETATGKKWAEAIEDRSNDAQIDAILTWARVSAAITRVETRQASRIGDGVGDADGIWAEIDPAWLSTPETWIEEIPHDLALALDRVVFDLNPGLFRQPGGSEAKKNGGISVG